MDYSSIKAHFRIKEEHGNKCKAICPAHPDKEASLSIAYDGSKGGTALFCHAGCETSDIVSAAGLKIRDLFDKPLQKDSEGKANTSSNIEAVYQYKDKDGNVLFEKVRFRPKRFSQRRTVKGLTIWGLEAGTYYETFPGSKNFSMKERKNNTAVEVEAVQPVIYNLPAVVEGINYNQTIYIVEGEKDVDNVNKLGLIATCNFDGASKSVRKPKWRREYNETFRGAKVVLIPDNDDPGRAHMENIAENLYDIAESIKIINLPGLSPKGDISDWLQVDHTKEELITIVQQTAVWSKNEGPEPDPDNDILGVYERGCSYYKFVKKDFHQISNFIIKVQSVIQSDSEVYINAIFHNVYGERMEKTFLTEAFDSIKQLRAMLNNPYFTFWGVDKDLQTIRNIIFSKEHKHKIGVKCIGFHKVNGKDVFVSTDMAIDREGNKVDNVVMLDDYVETITNLLSVDPITADELKSIAKDLFNFNRLGITATILGYTAGTFLAEKLRDKNIKYNHLMIEGTPGSGKSQTVENVITGLLGVGREDILDIGQCTSFALTKTSSSSNMIPLILNEYKPNRIGTIKVNLVSTIMRNSYDNSGVRKGTANLKKNKEFSYRAPLILIGESGMSETANIERSLKVMFYKKSHTTERFTAMANLKDNRLLLNKLGRSLLNLALKKDSKELSEKHRKLVIQMAKINIRDDRIKESIANCILGIALIREVFKSLNLDFEQETGVKMSELVDEIGHTAGEDLLMGAEGSKNVIDLTLETMNRMAINSVIIDKCDYDTVIDKDGDFILKLNYKAFYDRFLRYCKDNRIEHEVLQLESFEQQLSNMEYCKASKKVMKFNIKYESGETKSFRGMVLYVDKLRERNIDIDFMVDTDISKRELKVIGFLDRE